MGVATVERVTTAAALEALGPEWTSLLADARAPSVFQTWEWARVWWRVFGAGKDLLVLAFRDEASRLCGLAPLYRVRKGLGLFGVRELRFLGSGEEVKPDYLGIVARRGMEEAVASAFCRHLDGVADAWETACLSDVSDDAGYLDDIARHYRARGYRLDRRRAAVCRYVPLPDSYEKYLERLGRNLRYNIARRTKTLLRNLGGSLFVWEDPATVGEGIDELGRLHRKRWAGRHGSRSFATERYLAFHRTIAREFLERGWLRLYGLRVGGKTVAMLYCYHYGGRVYYYQSGFDPDWYKYSTGLVLCAFALRRAIEEGAREFDFLRGEHAYKEAWAPAVRSTWTLYLAKPTLRSRFDYALSVGVPQVKRRLRSVWVRTGR